MGQSDLFAGAESGRPPLVARWLALTRAVLPAMASAQNWPIHLDHCFMRVCLDTALGAPWTEAVRSPALRHMDDAQMAAALQVAEDIAAHPHLLAELNRRSIEGRRAAKATRAPGA